MTDYLADGSPGISAERGRAVRPPSRLDRPVFVVGPARSGIALLGDALARSPEAHGVGSRGDDAIESIPALHPGRRGWDSNRLGASDADAAAIGAVEKAMVEHARDREGRPPGGAGPLRLVASSARAALRIPFLAAAFPDSLFVYVYREPQECISSAVEAWESGRFTTYPELPGWDGPAWSLALTPEWRSLAGGGLPETAAGQWRMSSEILLGDLERLPPPRWAVVGHRDLVEDPRKELARLFEFTGLVTPADVPARLPVSEHAVSEPAPGKWRKRAAALDAVLPATDQAARRARDLFARPPERARARPRDANAAYRSVSTPGFAEALAQLGSTLLVTTYQTNKLVAVRAADGGLNTHFRGLENPMGISHHEGRLAVGTKSQVWEYHNLPQLLPRLSPPGRHDACFVPRTVSYTGDIRIHDVAWVGGELWFVATRFSCLATLDRTHSFVPRWRPPFITALAAEDRCHLNGMAEVDGEVRWVTALGETDTAGGWRESKASGGVLIDVPSGETVVRGLSMPHSPRWHRDRLWILESGQGSLATVDLDSGTVEPVAQLPGFTRGLAFAGPLAFVGLSEVREATTFGGLPLTGRLEERQCGVWVVNVESGQTVAYLRFEELVEEIFDVALLPGIRFPEIAEHGSDAVENSFVVPDGAEV